MNGQNGLVMAYGNPAREDDGLGPAAAEYLEKLRMEGVTVEAGYQLSLEDTSTVANHDFTVFIDASMEGEEPFSFTRLAPRGGPDFFSHSLGPERVLGLAQELFGKKREGFLLGIRGYSFTMFREGLSAEARKNLKKAMEFIVTFLHERTDTGGYHEGR